MKMLECINFNTNHTLLINIEEIEYCYLVKEDGYGARVDNISVITKNGTQFELKNGEQIYKLLKEKNNEHL